MDQSPDNVTSASLNSTAATRANNSSGSNTATSATTRVPRTNDVRLRQMTWQKVGTHFEKGKLRDPNMCWFTQCTRAARVENEPNAQPTALSDRSGDAGSDTHSTETTQTEEQFKPEAKLPMDIRESDYFSTAYMIGLEKFTPYLHKECHERVLGLRTTPTESRTDIQDGETGTQSLAASMEEDGGQRQVQCGTPRSTRAVSRCHVVSV